MCPGWGRRSDASSAAEPGSLPAALRRQNSRYCFPRKATVSESDATCWLYCVETAWKEQTEAEGDKPQLLGPRCSLHARRRHTASGGGSPITFHTREVAGSKPAAPIVHDGRRGWFLHALAVPAHSKPAAPILKALPVGQVVGRPTSGGRPTRAG